jgi:hypothetical protein
MWLYVWKGVVLSSIVAIWVYEKHPKFIRFLQISIFVVYSDFGGCRAHGRFLKGGVRRAPWLGGEPY